MLQYSILSFLPTVITLAQPRRFCGEGGTIGNDKQNLTLKLTH